MTLLINVSTSSSLLFRPPAGAHTYTLSLHDALPISANGRKRAQTAAARMRQRGGSVTPPPRCRSEGHTSELQSLRHIVCCLLLEKKKGRHKLFGSEIQF